MKFHRLNSEPAVYGMDDWYAIKDSNVVTLYQTELVIGDKKVVSRETPLEGIVPPPSTEYYKPGSECNLGKEDNPFIKAYANELLHVRKIGYENHVKSFSSPFMHAGIRGNMTQADLESALAGVNEITDYRGSHVMHLVPVDVTLTSVHNTGGADLSIGDRITGTFITNQSDSINDFFCWLNVNHYNTTTVDYRCRRPVITSQNDIKFHGRVAVGIFNGSTKLGQMVPTVLGYDLASGLTIVNHYWYDGLEFLCQGEVTLDMYSQPMGVTISDGISFGIINKSSNASLTVRGSMAIVKPDGTHEYKTDPVIKPLGMMFIRTDNQVGIIAHATCDIA